MQLLARPRRPEALPQRLDRHRIYVLPTRFGLFVATLLSAMLLGALNYNNNPALLLALLLAAAAIASAIAAHLQLSGIQIDAISAEPVPAGHPLRLRVDLSLRDPRARHGLHLQLGASEAWVALPAHGRGEVELDVPSERRGWLELPRIRLSSTQPLGLVRAWSWVWPEQPLLVYPLAEAQAPPSLKVAAIPCTPAPTPRAKSCISCALSCRRCSAQHCLETLGAPRQPAGTRVREADRHRSGAGLAHAGSAGP